MMTLQSRFDALLAQTTLTITPTQQRQLLGLVELLDKWNKAYNLTSVRDPQEMLVRHIFDSLAVAPWLEGERFIDVGTGPGLPGLPLAILFPAREFVLLDSLGKRIRFSRQVVLELGLTNVTPVQSRVEAYQPEQGFDGVLSRAFASLADMLHWCHHLPAATGCFLALKGQYPHEELASLPAGFVLQSVHPLQVPELDGERHLVIVKKQS